MCKTKEACTKLFSFDLDKSADIAKRWLERYVDCQLDSWGEVVASWKRAKSTLGEALCERTWRKILPIEIQFTPEEERRQLHLKLYDEGVTSHLDTFSYRDVAEGKVTETSSMLEMGVKAIKKGMKLSRAITALAVDKMRMSRDEASDRVGKAFDKWKAGRKGTLVLSANILDILQCSYSCSYSSCHGPRGCHCGGPQQYLHDDHTLIAYLYATTKEDVHAMLPYKTWRQLVHVDLRHKAAAFMRHYGTEIQEGTHKELRKMVAQLIAKLTGEKETNDPHWVIKRDGNGWEPTRDTSLAYVDAATSIIRLEDSFPDLQLAEAICPSCGDSTNKNEWDSSRFVCDECGDNRNICAGCGDRVDDEDMYLSPRGCIYCETCFREQFSFCEGCVSDVPANRMDSVRFWSRYGGHFRTVEWCVDCREKGAEVCDNCDDLWRSEDLVTAPNDSRYCRNCAPDFITNCDDCGDTCMTDDLFHICDKSVCESCYDDYHQCEECQNNYRMDNELPCPHCPTCAHALATAE